MVASVAKELKILTIGVVTRPFAFEGKQRAKNADEGIVALEENVDTLVVIPNERLIQVVGKATMEEAFSVADDVLRQGIQGISDLITVPSMINLDFADVKSIMEEKGYAHMGIGTASGDKRAIEAARQATESPLLETTIQGAKGVLLNITGGPNLGMMEVNEAAEFIQNAADPVANNIFGTGIDESLGDTVRITVIATGFNKSGSVRRQPPIKETQRPGRQTTTVGESQTGPKIGLSRAEVHEGARTPYADGSNLDLPTFVRNHPDKK